MSVLLDTGVLFAYLNADDRNHFAARELMLAVVEGALGAPMVTDLVATEFYNLVRSVRAKGDLETPAIALLEEGSAMFPHLHRIDVGHGRFGVVLDVYRRFRDARISFTDASLLVMKEEMGIDYLATFDRRLAGLTASVPRTD